MRMYDIIAKKRDSNELSESELAFFASGAADGSIPDYQLSALLMAIVLRGMSDRETICLTREMASSGDMLDMSRFGELSVDKHSTGGVGDKTTLIVAPIVASLGCKVAKMSGRGLGHTGGTVDKLESIPGFRSVLPQNEFMSQVERIGIAVTGACGSLVPADKKLYALRDVTATVESIPLIVSSVMSKKLAGGALSIVLDVKSGSGAFMHDEKNARVLAEKMVSIGRANGRNVVSVITDMNVPLGRAVGNAIEVREAMSLLRGEIKEGALYDISVRLASELCAMSLHKSVSESESLVRASLSSGRAYEKFLEWIIAQGGDGAKLESAGFGRAGLRKEIISPASGCISATDASGIGMSAMLLGAGRASKEDDIDRNAGIFIEKMRGEYAGKGDVLAVMYASDEALFAPAEQRYIASLAFSDSPPEATDPILGIIR